MKHTCRVANLFCLLLEGGGGSWSFGKRLLLQLQRSTYSKLLSPEKISSTKNSAYVIVINGVTLSQIVDEGTMYSVLPVQ